MSDETYDYDDAISNAADEASGTGADKPMSLKDAAAEVQRQEKAVARYSRAYDAQSERVKKLSDRLDAADSVLTETGDSLGEAKTKLAEARAVLDRALNG